MRVEQAADVDIETVIAWDPELVVLSPGPGHPADAQLAISVVQRLGPRTPIFGVCLGHQAAAMALGATITRGPQPVHGKTSACEHDGSAMFAGLPSPMAVARYHSLLVERGSVPDALVVAAWTTEGEVMALRHRTWPLWTVQFHPESFLMPHGDLLLARVLELARSHRRPPC